MSGQKGMEILGYLVTLPPQRSGPPFTQPKPPTSGNPFKAETWNLSRIMEVVRRDPEEAKRLMIVPGCEPKKVW